MKWGTDSPRNPENPHKKNLLGTRRVQLGLSGASACMTAIGVKNKRLLKKQEELRAARIIGEDEEVTGVIEEVSYGDTLQ
jgi:hypothetical protein